MQTTKLDQHDAAYIPGPKVCSRYNVTDMTIHRWLNDVGMDSPCPYYFGRFRYWLLAELETWERAQPRRWACTRDNAEAAWNGADKKRPL